MLYIQTIDFKNGHALNTIINSAFDSLPIGRVRREKKMHDHS